jgi:hypothetical protein
MNLRGNSIGTDGRRRTTTTTHFKSFHLLDKPIGASPRRDYRSDEDGTILAHNILHGFDWNIEKGGNAPRAPDEMRDFYPPQAS